MRKIAIGVFAHVDAGKTTFCEALLHATGAIQSPGRVDHRNTLLDHDALERRRGITIYSDVAAFTHNKQAFYLVDTPGHVDFSAETERVLPVLDAAILLISGPDGVQGHTLTLYRLLRRHRVPVYFFFNKMDQPGADARLLTAQIAKRLDAPCLVADGPASLSEPTFLEEAAEYDDILLERYLEGDGLEPAFVAERLRGPIAAAQLALAGAGCALRGEGVTNMLELLAATLPPAPAVQAEFAARVFKVRYDEKGARVCFLRVLQGEKQVRAELAYPDGETEKLHEIRAYQGGGYTSLTAMQAGDIVGVTGLARANAGQGFGCESAPGPLLRPALRATVLAPDTPRAELLSALRRLEAQDPLLAVEPMGDILEVKVMGRIQLEVLAEMLQSGYGIQACFGPARIVYKETVGSPVMGYGHFEPLRHYAEVHLRLEPNPGGGIVFASELHMDRLPAAYQHLIRHTLLDEAHAGILTGSPLADIRFVLTAGAYHLKHTHGGDLQEAARRAVRQGLEKAQSILLEPWYGFAIEVQAGHVGRVMSDITRLKGEFAPPDIQNERAVITGAGPVETLLDYPAELGAFTGGRGAISLTLSGWRPCHDAQRIIGSIGYEKERDLAHSSSSVFCSHGAGFEVKWHEAEDYMHLLK